MILRFVPYIGAILAASLPIALAAAVGSDWSMSLWTIALFAVMEPLTGQVVEPLVCGRSAGLLYPSAIRAHVGASLTARLAGEPRLDIGYPEGADQGKKFGRPSALDAGQKRKIADSCGQAGAAFGVKPHDESLIGQAEIFEAPEVYLLCRRRCAARSTPAGGSRSFKAPRGGAVRPAGEGECHHHKRPAAWRLPRCVNG
jgi:hypothetical protein